MNVNFIVLYGTLLQFFFIVERTLADQFLKKWLSLVHTYLVNNVLKILLVFSNLTTYQDGSGSNSSPGGNKSPCNNGEDMAVEGEDGVLKDDLNEVS